MKKIIFTFAVILFTANTFALDWGGKSAPISNMYIYPTYVVVIQGDIYSGQANCNSNGAWSFYWSSLDQKVADRVYAALLAAKISKAPIRPIFADDACGPEGNKKFSGYFNMQD